MLPVLISPIGTNGTNCGLAVNFEFWRWSLLVDFGTSRHWISVSDCMELWALALFSRHVEIVKPERVAKVVLQTFGISNPVIIKGKV
jgi:hypothetical protein